MLSTLSAKTTLLTPSAPGLGTYSGDKDQSLCTLAPLFISENVTDKKVWLSFMRS